MCLSSQSGMVLLFLFFLSLTSCVAQESEVTEDYHLIGEKIDQAMQRLHECHHLAGLAVSVIRNETDILTKTYGYSRIEPPTPFRNDTHFFLASVSKMFTSTLIGALLNKHSKRYPAGFETLVIEIMGSNFRMSNILRTKHATVKDVLAHRLGLLQYRWIQIMGLDPSISRQDYCRRMRFIKPAKNSFRDKFRYSNFMYVLAACIAERLGGNRTYTALLKEFVLEPVGMNDTTTVRGLLEGHKGLNEYGEEAWPQSLARMYYQNETTKQLKLIDTDVVRSTLFLESAGGVVSTLSDMRLWMKMLLRGGVTEDGRRLMPETQWSDLFRPHLHGTFPVAPFPVLDTTESIGLGWMMGYYRNLEKRLHEGRLLGYEAKITHIPSRHLALFTITNGPHFRGTYVNRAAHAIIIDAALGFQPWLNDTTRCSYPAPWVPKKPFVPLPRAKSLDDFEDSEQKGEDAGNRSEILGEDDPEDEQYIEHQMEARSVSDQQHDVRMESMTSTSMSDTVTQHGESCCSAEPATYPTQESATEEGQKRYKIEDDESAAVRLSSNSSSLLVDPDRYTGLYGHPLFGNVTISFNETDGLLHLRYGVVGRGRLLANKTGIWHLDFTDGLWYYNRVSENRNNLLQIEFKSPGPDGLFHRLKAEGFERDHPPVFIRGLWWDSVEDDDDSYYHPFDVLKLKSDASSMKQNKCVLMKVMLVAFTMRLWL